MHLLRSTLSPSPCSVSNKHRLHSAGLLQARLQHCKACKACNGTLGPSWTLSHVAHTADHGAMTSTPTQGLWARPPHSSVTAEGQASCTVCIYTLGKH